MDDGDGGAQREDEDEEEDVALPESNAVALAAEEQRAILELAASMADEMHDSVRSPGSRGAHGRPSAIVT